MKIRILKFLLFLFLLTFNISLINSVIINTCGTSISTKNNYTLNSNLNCPGQTAIIFNSGSDGSTLDCQNYQITGDNTPNTYGIYLNNTNSINIKNCNVSSFYDGIYLRSSSKNTLSSITANNNYNGIFFYTGSNNTLSSITANNNYFGIYLVSSSNSNTLSSITANNNNYGIYLYTGSNNTLSSIIVNNNKYNGFVLFLNSNNTLSSITANNNNYGIYLSSSSNNNLSSITANNNNYYGIYFYSSSNNLLKNSNLISNNNSNLYFYATSGSNSNTIYNNTLGNISKIQSNNWTYWNTQFNFSGIGNIYYNDSNFGLGKTICFDAPSNNNCDYIATISSFINISYCDAQIYAKNNYTLNSNLNCPGQTAIIFNSGSDGSTLDCQNYNMTGDGTVSTFGIRLNSRKNINIKNCNIYNFYSGIYINGGSNNNITNSIVNQNTYSGIRLDSNSKSNNLLNITAINNSQHGFDYSSTSYNYAFNLTGIENGWSSIHLELNSNYNNFTLIKSQNNHYTGFGFASQSNNNIIDSFESHNDNISAMLIANVSNNIVKNSIFNNGSNSGVIFQDASFNNTILNSTSYGNYWHGFRISYSSHNNLIINSTAFNNTYFGFSCLSNSYNNTFKNIISYNNYDGVFTQVCLSLNITNITAYNNSMDGIYMRETNNSYIKNAQIETSQYGIYIYSDSNFNKINDVKIHNISNKGLTLVINSNYNSIENITVNISYDGLYILNSSHNYINEIKNFNSSHFGIYLRENSNYNNLSNLYLKNNSYGLYMYNSSSYNIIKNISIYDTLNFGFSIEYYSMNNIVNNLTNYNSYVGVYLNYVANNNNLSNIYVNKSDFGIYNYYYSKYNNYKNIQIYNISNYGLGLLTNSNFINIDNLTSKYNREGMYIFYSGFNNITNSAISNNAEEGIYLDSIVTSSYFISNIIKNNGKYDLYFLNSSTSNPTNNYFYGNYFTNSSKIVSWNWSSTPNYFNSSLSGYNIGNYWEDLSCLEAEYRGPNFVCSNPNNYTINLTHLIYDFAPLISSETPNYIYPTPFNNSQIAKKQIVIKIGGSIAKIQNCQLNFSGNIYSMQQVTPTTCELNISLENYSQKEKATFKATYEFNPSTGTKGLKERTIYIYWDKSKVDSIPFYTWFSFLISIILIYIYNIVDFKIYSKK